MRAYLLISTGEKLNRINQKPVLKHFKVQMGSIGAFGDGGIPDSADDNARINLITYCDRRCFC